MRGVNARALRLLSSASLSPFGCPFPPPLPSLPRLSGVHLGDALLERGWYHDRQAPPDNLHSTVSNTNTGAIDQYLVDLAECVATVGTTDDRSTTYATLE